MAFVTMIRNERLGTSGEETAEQINQKTLEQASSDDVTILQAAAYRRKSM
jgi:hypothetical protein